MKKFVSRPKKQNDPYKLDSCFGFSDDDIDLPISETLNSSSRPKCYREFQADKPFRYALYVQPRIKKSVDLTITKDAEKTKSVDLTIMKDVEKPKSVDVTKTQDVEKPKSVDLTKTKEVEKPKAARKRNARKMVDKSQKENSIVDSSGSILKTRYPRRAKKDMSGVLAEMNNSCMSDFNNEKEEKNGTDFIEPKKIKPAKESSFSVPKTKQKKYRRSYEKKFKEPSVPEPPSEAIFKEMDMSKISRTKKKTAKDNKDEKEFEKWAENINNEFDDVDKFELSISYD